MIGSRIVGKSVEEICGTNLTVTQNLCSRIRYKKSTCSLCMDVCPVNAIKMEDDRLLITETCMECGACYSACPNGAINLNDKDDVSILSLIKDGIKRSEDRILRIKCSRSKDERKGILTVPCLARLTEELLLGVLLFEAESIQILKPECSGCRFEKGVYRFLDVFVLSNDIVNALQIDPSKIRMVQSFGNFREPSINIDTPLLNRRDFFRGLGARTVSITEKAFKPDTEESNIITDRCKNGKRNLLLNITRKLKEKHGLNTEETTRFSSLNVPFGNASINNSRCIGCGVCYALCPTGALRADENNDNLSIHFENKLCINCRLCSDACRQKAMNINNAENIVEALGLNKDATAGNAVILKKQKRICLKCKAPYYTEGESCTSCNKYQIKRELIINSILSMEGPE